MYFSKETIARARELDLLTYLQLYEPNELVRVSNNNYHIKTHDSLKISNGRWYWFSRGIGGVSALDFLVKVRGYTFFQAVSELTGLTDVKSPSVMQKSNYQKSRTIKEDKGIDKDKLTFVLPKANDNNSNVIQYLINKRGIHRDVLKHYINDKTIYESANFHSCIFVGKDENGVVKFATQRGTTSHFHGDCKGSDKSYPFSFINENTSRLYVFEASIDMLSYQSFLQYKNVKWQNANYIALSGIYKMKEIQSGAKLDLPIGLANTLNRLVNIKSIVLCFDNDNVGKGASEMLKQILQDKYEVMIHQPKTKDINEDLVEWKNKLLQAQKKKDIDVR